MGQRRPVRDIHDRGGLRVSRDTRRIRKPRPRCPGTTAGHRRQEVDGTLAGLPAERSLGPDPADAPLTSQQRAQLATFTEAMERALAG